MSCGGIPEQLESADIVIAGLFHRAAPTIVGSATGDRSTALPPPATCAAGFASSFLSVPVGLGVAGSGVGPHAATPARIKPSGRRALRISRLYGAPPSASTVYLDLDSTKP
jgi:hypothetical protein